jgi:hypothetical protein
MNTPDYPVVVGFFSEGNHYRQLKCLLTFKLTMHTVMLNIIPQSISTTVTRTGQPSMSARFVKS